MQTPSQTHDLLLLLPLCLLLLNLLNGHGAVAVPTEPRGWRSAAASAGGSGFGFQIIHRDSIHSPVYPGNLTSYELLMRRVNYAKAHIQQIEYRMSRGNGAADLDIITPIIEHEEGTHEYFVRVYIGSEKVFQYLHMDTGSDLVWVQCEPYASSHFIQDPPHYVIGESSTMSYFPCSDKTMCLESYSCNGKKCLAQEFYADGTWAMGHLARESFHFENDAGNITTIQDIVFGCMSAAAERMFPSSKVAGIIGMGLGRQSIISQLHLDRGLGNQFTYCLVPAISPSMSYLKFGDGFKFNGSSVTLSMIKNLKHSNYYYVNLTGISCHLTRLNIPKKTFAIDAAGIGGCGIDSGSSYSSLIEPAYEVLKTFIIKYFRSSDLVPAEDDGPLDLCFMLNGGPMLQLPSVTFHFAGKNLWVAPELIWERFLYNGNNFICLGISPSKRFTLIGANMQANYRFVYDMPSSTVSYGPEYCAHEQ